MIAWDGRSGMVDMDSSATTATPPSGVALRTWAILGLLLLATMLMYMDRQALRNKRARSSARCT